MWLDAETTGDGGLDLDANDESTEDFGIGGQKNWGPQAAGAGDGRQPVAVSGGNVP